MEQLGAFGNLISLPFVAWAHSLLSIRVYISQFRFKNCTYHRLGPMEGCPTDLRTRKCELARSRVYKMSKFMVSIERLIHFASFHTEMTQNSYTSTMKQGNSVCLLFTIHMCSHSLGSPCNVRSYSSVLICGYLKSRAIYIL